VVDAEVVEALDPPVQRGAVLDGQGDEVVLAQGLGGRRIEAQLELGAQVRDVENDGEKGAVGAAVVGDS
jgi:hypothetical protein